MPDPVTTSEVRDEIRALLLERESERPRGGALPVGVVHTVGCRDDVMTVVTGTSDVDPDGRTFEVVIRDVTFQDEDTEDDDTEDE
jgi:hypothetical protein